jgi:DNA repair exonuclease SbcCD nuclease subunit
MKIDILSDLHIDFYFRGKPTEDSVRKLYGNILGGGDMLVVAGDLGHDNRQNIRTLKVVREVFGYRHILCVLGNHDYYLVDHAGREKYFHRSAFRAQRMREIINGEEGMRALDGEVVEIDGVRFGGCDGWYDGAYILEHFRKKDDAYMDAYVSMLWRRTMSDARYVLGMDWREYAEVQKEKLRRIHREVDVMVTHVNPSIRKEHTPGKYRDLDTTGFFTFDGEEFLENGGMKYWIFGHTHDRTEYELHGVGCLCNPMGYPGENMNGPAPGPMRIVL